MSVSNKSKGAILPKLASGFDNHFEGRFVRS